VAFSAIVAYIHLSAVSEADRIMANQAQANSQRTWSEWPGWPYVIGGLCVLLRLAHIWNSRVSPTFWAPAVDPGWYDQVAQNILRGNWGPFPFFRAPLYPALLAGVYGVFGHDLVAARVLNVVLQTFTGWAIWRVGRSYFSPAVGVIASALFAVNGTTIYFAGEILSTSAEMLAAILALWATLRVTRAWSSESLVLCGLAWGTAAITRPNFLFALPVVLVGLWVSAKKSAEAANRKPLAALISGAAVWFVGLALPIAPVTAANAIYGGEFVLIATQGGVNFWIGNNPESTGVLSVLPGYGNTWTMEDAEAEAERETGRSLKPGELSRFYYEKGQRFLADNPAPALRFIIRKAALFFNRFEVSNNKHMLYFSGLSPWLPPLMYLNFGLLVPLGLLGSFALWRRFEIKILIGLALIYALSVVLFFVTSRFRMPTVPWLLLIAACAMVWTAETLSRRTNVRGLWPLLLLLPGAALACMNPWNLGEAPVGWARYMEGNAYLHLNRLDSAQVCLEDAIRDGQAVDRALLNLGVVKYRRGDVATARQHYEESLLSNPKNADAWNNLGTVCESLGDTGRAIESYRQALALRPSAPDPSHNLAGIHFRQGIAALKSGADSVAIAAFLQSLASEPSASAHYNLAVALGRTGYSGAAVMHLDSALALDPRMPAAFQLRERLRESVKALGEGAAAP